MAIGRNDNYVQRTFTADTFCKRGKRENSTVGPGFMSCQGDSSTGNEKKVPPAHVKLGATNARGVGRERRGNLRGGCMSKLCVE